MPRGQNQKLVAERDGTQSEEHRGCERGKRQRVQPGSENEKRRVQKPRRRPDSESEQYSESESDGMRHRVNKRSKGSKNPETIVELSRGLRRHKPKRQKLCPAGRARARNGG